MSDAVTVAAFLIAGALIVGVLIGGIVAMLWVSDHLGKR
jgi:hypothetical protein